MQLSECIARFSANIDYDVLPQGVKDMAISCVYNYFGCVYAGSAEPPVQPLKAMLQHISSIGCCRILGAGLTADPAMAALVNGTSGNSLGYDDVFNEGVFHPGISIVTAATTIAQLKKVSGKRLVEAIVAGYEVADRLALILQPSHYRYWHTTATAGSIGAAVAASVALELSAEQTIHAIGIAGTQATGLQECNGNMNQRLHHGTAARNGVLGALMARENFQSANRILDGKAGLINAMSDFRGDPLNLFEDLGTKFYILRTSIKYYPCCAHIHSCIDAILDAVHAGLVHPDEISRIIVGTYKAAIVNSGNPEPSNLLQAKFSFAYCLATAAITGELTMDSFSAWPPSYQTKELMKKVELVCDDDCEKGYSHGIMRGYVVLNTSRGNFSAKRDFHRGDPEAPLSRQEIIAKFRQLSRCVLSDVKIRQLEENIALLPSLPDASILTRF